jgi:dynein light intermediate chain 1
LNFALTEANYSDTTVLLCVAMTNPWNIMDQLQNWASLLQVL